MVPLPVRLPSWLGRAGAFARGPVGRCSPVRCLLALCCSFSLVVGGGLAAATAARGAASNPEEDQHYGASFCQAADRETERSVRADTQAYSSQDLKAMCDCHSQEPGIYIHPSGIEPSTRLAPRIPEGFPLSTGELTCMTCHDPVRLCLEPGGGSSSLRGGPYETKTAVCFRCHDGDSYERYDCHDQLDARGKIIEGTCLFCHSALPDEWNPGYQDLEFVGDMDDLCERCHPMGPHCAGVDHLRIPSKQMRNRMAAVEKKFNTLLPLDKSGRLTCVTCHNPHEKGVIPAYLPSARGAGEPMRHRLPGTLCTACHSDRM